MRAPGHRGRTARARRGLTLAEVLVTIAVVAGLAAAFGPSAASARQEVGEGQASAAAADVAAAADGFLARTHSYPGGATAFTAAHGELPGVQLAGGLTYRITRVDADGRGARADVLAPDGGIACTVGLGRRATAAPACGDPDAILAAP